ncbi:AsnC family transcriptional regulator [Sphaerisporangium melleum]|uniref:AsnC family transcriptional regulator n=1 Tax=Sphaerisporangium melleum TaxID=321316 RepID=A0A917VTM5_9ACTN|nr:Lrp/AsnC family transcriptional regulator [Sphaerisporangium melleum]GGL17303.1 AsnC family transcriptional regulator [Sphaerisporangium melleum]GII74710.1 AsnC family transcriptional regulator [Sphaerisporangium melleum]
MPTAHGPLDDLDGRLIATMRTHPRVGLTELARLLGVARGTVQARVDKLVGRGVIGDFGPTIVPAEMGYPILAFVSLQIAQGRLTEAVQALESVPEILEVYGTSGQGDLLCRVVARSTVQLQEIIARVLSSPAVQRTDTTIALSTQIPYRIEPLLKSAAHPRPE